MLIFIKNVEGLFNINSCIAITMQVTTLLINFAVKCYIIIFKTVGKYLFEEIMEAYHTVSNRFKL